MFKNTTRYSWCMAIESLLATDFFNLVIMPLLIIVARVMDVSLGTVRVIAINRGDKHLAPLIGFFEVLIWLIVINQLLSSFQHWTWYVAYAIGFASGTFIGMSISEKFTMGKAVVRIMTETSGTDLIRELEKNNYKMAVVKTTFNTHKGVMLFVTIDSDELDELLKLVHNNNPKAVFSVEDVRRVSYELVSLRKRPTRKFFPTFAHMARKSK